MILKRLSYALLITSCLLTKSYASQAAFTLDDEGNTTFHGQVKLTTTTHYPALSVAGETELLSNVSITGDVNLNDHTLTNLKTPTNPTDAANKAYIDTPIKEIRDIFQTLPSSNNVTWDLSNGNVADLSLNSTSTSLIINMANATRGTLRVKQDQTGNRELILPQGVYRPNSSSSLAPLSFSPNSIDLLSFQRVNQEIYLINISNQMSPITGVGQKIFDTIKAPVTFSIFSSPNNVCRIKLLGGGGGQGLHNGGGSSGAGGFTVYHFNTTNYLGQELKVVVGSGGKGGSQGKPASKGGYPNGGNGGSHTGGSHWLGGGGGRSEVRIGMPNQSFEDSTSLAIAGAGAGGSGYYPSWKSGAGGGESGQNDNTGAAKGGTQISEGASYSAYSKEFFLPAGKYQGAGFIIPLNNINTSYYVTGGGDGYYGGGAACGGNIYSSSGGSGYINKTFLPGFLAQYSNTDSATYMGNYTQLNPLAVSDPNFNINGLGIGREGGQNGAGVIGLNGGNGRVVVDFL